MEQDVVPPSDAIQRLLGHGKDIVSGLYFTYQANNGVNSLTPLLWKKQGKDSIRFISGQEISANKLIEVAACGLGCVLIHRNVLKEVKFRYDLNSFDDRWFFLDLYDKKIPVYADTSIKCKHLIYNRPYPWSKIKK